MLVTVGCGHDSEPQRQPSPTAPDEMHCIVIAKIVLKRYHDGHSWDFGI